MSMGGFLSFVKKEALHIPVSYTHLDVYKRQQHLRIEPGETGHLSTP